MEKKEAVALLGGTRRSVAEAVGCTVAAVNQWPDVLTDKIRDRVQAALYRKQQQEQEARYD